MAFLAAALACTGTVAGTIKPVQDNGEYSARSVLEADAVESTGPGALNGFSLLPLLEPDDPLALLSELKLGGEVVLTLPIDLGSDNPLMAGLTPHAASTKIITLQRPGSVDSVSMAALALGGAGLLGLSLALWRRSARRARRRTSRRRNGGLQTA